MYNLAVGLSLRSLRFRAVGARAYTISRICTKDSLLTPIAARLL
jgi:hypothetical protein